MKIILNLLLVLFSSNTIAQDLNKTVRGVVKNDYTKLSQKTSDYYSGSSDEPALTKNDTIFIISYFKPEKSVFDYEYFETFYEGKSYFVNTKYVELLTPISNEELKKQRENLINATNSYFKYLDTSFIKTDTNFIVLRVEKYTTIAIYDTTEDRKKLETPQENEEIYLYSCKGKYSIYNQYYALYKNKTVILEAMDYGLTSIKNEIQYLQYRKTFGINQRYESCLKNSIIRNNEIEKRKQDAENSRLLSLQKKEEYYNSLDTTLLIGVVKYATKLKELNGNETEEMPTNSLVFPISYKEENYNKQFEVFHFFKRGFVDASDIEISDTIKNYLIERKEKNINDRIKVAQFADSAYTKKLLKKYDEKMQKFKKMQFVIEEYEIFNHNEYSDATDIRVDFYNATNKTIKYIWFTFVAYNRVGDIVGGLGGGTKQVKGVGPISDNASGSLTFEYLFLNSVVSCAKITAIKVQYTDGTIKTFQPNLCLDEDVINNCK